MAVIRSQKTALYLGAAIGSPENFVKVGGITDIGAPESSTTEIDTTDLESDAKESIPGLKDYGTITAQLKYDPALAPVKDIEALADTGTVRNWQIRYSDGKTKKSFTAFVKSYNPSAAVDGIVKGPLTLRITGPVTTTYV